ncbi:MAG TPA: FAD-dependent oxidoreductase [Actinomycetes bacterium]|nr:FAD-dependent oxidoreductase [Actinomycetes bacterium]
MSSDLPQRARIVVVGGGVGGASIAYHLAQRGETDVLVLERSELTSGSTFHSAGLVGQLRGSVVLTRMMMDSAELYRKLAGDPDTDPGWIECGGIRLACSPERMEELERQVGWAESFGLPLQRITAAEAEALFPPMSTERVLGATYLATDGYLDPSRLTYVLAAEARRAGVRIAERTRLLGIDVVRGAVRGVRTDRGDVECELVVDAAGMYAAEVARLVGVRVPIVPMSHQYVVTMPFRDLEPGAPRLPTLRDPDLLVYFREEGAGLVMGGYERDPSPFALGSDGFDAVPADFNGRLLAEDWPRLEEITTNSVVRVPAMADVELRQVVNGPEGFTPDNEFCLGPSEVTGFWVAAGFCAHGIAGAGGMGKVMADWLVDGDPGMDLWEMDVRRFGAHYGSPTYTLARVLENYSTYYDIRYPGQERTSGRPLRMSPAYPWHEAHGAVFGEKGGWERVNYYAPHERLGDAGRRPLGWAGHLWSPAIEAEHRATREHVGLFDETSFAKIEVSGPDAATLLERLCDNRVAGAVGRVTYTQMLNRRGGVECDFTVARLGEQVFHIVTGTAFGGHDLSWIRRHAVGDVTVRDVTSAWACYGIWGPMARDVLQPLTPQSLDNEAFPYMSARLTTVGGAPARLLRVTFVGELGWEVYVPMEHGAAVWRLLADATDAAGGMPCGYKAIDSLRAEKGYRYWGSDVTGDETPYEAGLGFCVRADKSFVGSDTLDPEPLRRLVCLTLDDPQRAVLGNEPVRVEGRTVGRVTSGAIGHTVDASIAFAYLPRSATVPGTRTEVLVFGEWVGATVRQEPLYDPSGERVRS